MSNWSQYFNNPRGHYLRKTLFELMKQKYAEHDQIIERLGSMLQTEGDLKAFLKFVSDVYELGYMKSVADHREQLEKIGIRAKVVADQKSNEG